MESFGNQVKSGARIQRAARHASHAARNGRLQLQKRYCTAVHAAFRVAAGAAVRHRPMVLPTNAGGFAAVLLQTYRRSIAVPSPTHRRNATDAANGG
jgi:hypothetical protein